MSYFGSSPRDASIICFETSQAFLAARMSRARSWVSQVKPSPMVRISTCSGNLSSTPRSPVCHLPFTYCTTPTFRPLPIARTTSPNAAVDFPLPFPVWTISRPFSMVLVARILSRAALRLRAFSLALRLISSSEPVSSLEVPSVMTITIRRAPSAGAGTPEPSGRRVCPRSPQASFLKAIAQPAPSTTQKAAFATAVATMNV